MSYSNENGRFAVEPTLRKGNHICSYQNPNFLQSGHTSFHVQKDGNLVVYCLKNGRKAVWTSNTKGKGRAPYYLTHQRDGNLVLYDQDSKVIWASNTYGHYGQNILKVQSDGNVVLYDNNSKILW
jgi:hypothetical protein